MKHILFITNTFPSDNRLIEGRFNYKAAKALSEKIPVSIVHLRSWKPFRSIVTKKKIGVLKVIVFSFPYYPTSNSFLNGLQLWLYKNAFSAILGNKFKDHDVIHSVGASFASVVASMVSKKHKLPHIAQCIGTDVNYTLPQLKNSFGVKGFNKNVSYFTTNSFELEKQVKLIYPHAKTQTIYRGVDLINFKSDFIQFSKKNTNKIVFTFIGGLSMRKETGKGRDYKGGETLLNSWKSLEDLKGMELNFAGPEVTPTLVDKILKNNHTAFNINVFGILSKEEVIEMLINSDVVIIPSWAEGLPNAGMEALAASCIIVGSNVGGIPELIDGNGYLFKPGDILELARILKKLPNDRIKLEEMKKHSRHLAINKFDNNQFVKHYLELYEKV